MSHYENMADFFYSESTGMSEDLYYKTIFQVEPIKLPFRGICFLHKNSWQHDVFYNPISKEMSKA